MSFRSEYTESGKRWKIADAVVCEDEQEAKSVASTLRKGLKGSGVEVRTKPGAVKCHGARIEVWFVVKRHLYESVRRREREDDEPKRIGLPELASFFRI